MASSIKFLTVLFFAVLMTGSAFTTKPLTRSNNRRSATSLNLVSPSDFTDVSSLVLAKYDAKTMGIGAFTKLGAGAKILDPDLQAQVLSDGSHALMDFPSMFKVKMSKLQMRYAQVIGRLMVLGVGLLPNHGYSHEEVAVQLFLLAVSMKPVIRSIKLYRCISSSKCLEECELELHDLESSLP